MEESIEVGDIVMYPFTSKLFNESGADKTRAHDIIKLYKEEKDAIIKLKKEERDASKKEWKTNDSNWSDHDVVMELHGFIHMVFFAILPVVNHLTTWP